MLFTIILGIYPSIILDLLHYSVTTLIYFIESIKEELLTYTDNQPPLNTLLQQLNTDNYNDKLPEIVTQNDVNKLNRAIRNEDRLTSDNPEVRSKAIKDLIELHRHFNEIQRESVRTGNYVKETHVVSIHPKVSFAEMALAKHANTLGIDKPGLGTLADPGDATGPDHLNITKSIGSNSRYGKCLLHNGQLLAQHKAGDFTDQEYYDLYWKK